MVVCKYFFNFHLCFGGDGPNLTSIFFSHGLVQPPTSIEIFYD